MPREEAIFAGDDLPTSRHFAAFESDKIAVGCASFHLNSWENQPAYQLRGMATDPHWCGRGIGTQVLGAAMRAIRSDSAVALFWCNARLAALGFYKKLGWAIASERFEIPTAGPHYRMVLRDISQVIAAMESVPGRAHRGEKGPARPALQTKPPV